MNTPLAPPPIVVVPETVNAALLLPVNVAPSATVIVPVTVIVGSLASAVAPALVAFPTVKLFVTVRVWEVEGQMVWAELEEGYNWRS